MASMGLEVDQRRMDSFRSNADREGLEALPAEHVQGPAGSAPEVFLGADEEAAVISQAGLAEKEINKPPTPDSLPIVSTFRRRKKLWLLLALVTLAILVVAIAVPLATRDKGNSRPHAVDNNSTSSPPPGYLSTSGAFNGTRLTTFRVDPENISTTHIFYQDFAGQIRRFQKEGSEGPWMGGPDFPAIVISDAKNATPLACINYTDPESNINTAHLFYVNSSNFLEEQVSTDDLATWHPGPLGRANFLASNTAIAMVALYSERWFGNMVGDSPGLRLYYGGPDNQVQEIAYALGDSSWSSQSIFNNTNGNAGISAGRFFRRTGTASLYTWDTNAHVRVWNLNSTVKANSSLSTYGNWTEEPTVATLNKVAPYTSLAYAQTWLAYQKSDGAIMAIQSYPTGRADVPWGQSIMTVGGDKGEQRAQRDSALLAGSVWLGDNQASPFALDLWWQENGNDVIECININYDYTITPLPVVD